MFLAEALDRVRESLVKRRVSAGESLWLVIVKQISDCDCFDGQHGEAVEEVVQSFVCRLNDGTTILLWRETEPKRPGLVAED